MSVKRGIIALMLSVSVATAGGYMVGSLDTPAPVSSPSVALSPSYVYTVPTGPVATSTPAAEDMPGWDCRAQGFHDCVINDERWLNLDHLPDQPYLRCLIVWNAMGSDVLNGGDGLTYDAVAICKPLLDLQG